VYVYAWQLMGYFFYYYYFFYLCLFMQHKRATLQIFYCLRNEDIDAIFSSERHYKLCVNLKGYIYVNFSHFYFSNFVYMKNDTNSTISHCHWRFRQGNYQSLIYLYLLFFQILLYLYVYVTKIGLFDLYSYWSRK
jgi:hypothetical protein